MQFDEMRGFLLDKTSPVPDKGDYLVAFDADAHEGLGAVVFRPDPTDAMVFRSQADAYGYWMTPSKKMPTRPDGNPNRPLTCCSVTIIPDPLGRDQ